MNGFLRIAAVVLLITPPLVAQTLQHEQIVLLKSPSGKYLSAPHGQQRLALSPNTAGWEQWQYIRDDSGTWFVSFHGTSLIVWDVHMNIPAIHAPKAVVTMEHADDLAVGPIETYTDSHNVTHHYVQYGDSIVAGAPFAITSERRKSALCEEGAGLTTKSVLTTVDLRTKFNVPTTNPNECGWKAVPVAAAQGGRATRRVSVVNGDGPAFRSTHGTFVSQGSRIDRGRYNAIHATSTTIPLDATFRVTFGVWDPYSSRTNPIYYGKDVWLTDLTTDGTNPLLCLVPNEKGLLELVAAQTSPASAWRIVDPAGIRKTSDRVAWADRIVLRHTATGNYLSANPEQMQLNLAPHADKWEQWTVSRYP